MQNKGAADLSKEMPPITSTTKIGFATGAPADPVGVQSEREQLRDTEDDKLQTLDQNSQHPVSHHKHIYSRRDSLNRCPLRDTAQGKLRFYQLQKWSPTTLNMKQRSFYSCTSPEFLTRVPIRACQILKDYTFEN